MGNAEIVVRFTQEGFHLWPDAPEPRRYLRNLHRHLFHVEVVLEVRGDNREVEFHDLLDYCRAQFTGGNLSSRSCEHMARALMEKVTRQYPDRRVTVGVFEDGEVGARVSS